MLKYTLVVVSNKNLDSVVGRPTGVYFKSLERYEFYIEDHAKNFGLDWRVGYAVKFKNRDEVYNIINTKTGIIVKHK
jgi:hypothetical protein